MDIKRAKQEIKDSIEAYLAKDEFGEYWILTYLDGEPMRQYKESDVDYGGADLDFE